VLIFFIAGLLYLLRFERVDNLGAYSIPSETGLLIPSDYINHYGIRWRFGVEYLCETGSNHGAIACDSA
jgi:hypothetical protein